MPDHNLRMPKYELLRSNPQTIPDDDAQLTLIEWDSVAFNNRNIMECNVPSTDVTVLQDGIYTGRLSVGWDFDAAGIRAIAMALPTPDDPTPEIPALAHTFNGQAAAGGLVPAQFTTYPITAITLIGDIGPINAGLYQNSGGPLDIIFARLVLRRLADPDRIKSIF